MHVSRQKLLLLEKMPEELAEHNEKLKLDLLERHKAQDGRAA